MALVNETVNQDSLPEAERKEPSQAVEFYEGEEEDDDDDDYPQFKRRRGVVDVRRECPYLDTVNRQVIIPSTYLPFIYIQRIEVSNRPFLFETQVLDFDFEKFCSVSLSNLNVYGCLVCGKYFQGRARKSHAYTHSLEMGHHVFINLHTEKIYCLPDGYEVSDPSLDDIRSVLNPRFKKH